MLNPIVLIFVLYMFILPFMGSIAGSPRILFDVHAYIEDRKLLVSIPTLSLFVDGIDTYIERYAYEVRIRVYIARDNDTYALLDRVVSYSSFTDIEGYELKEIRLLDLGSIDPTICGDRCMIGIEFEVTKLGIDLGLSRSLPWLFSFWPWKPCTMIIPIARSDHGYEADLSRARIYTDGVDSSTYIGADGVGCIVDVYPSKQFASYMVNRISYIPNSVLSRIECSIHVLLPLIIAVLALNIALVLYNLVKIEK